MGCPRGCLVLATVHGHKSSKGGYKFSPEVRIIVDSFSACPVGCPYYKVIPALSAYCLDLVVVIVVSP